jgi:hypothetical protein
VLEPPGGDHDLPAGREAIVSTHGTCSYPEAPTSTVGVNQLTPTRVLRGWSMSRGYR